MKFGIVKYFNLHKGYGLIAREDGKKDIIVLQSDINQAGLGQVAEHQTLGFDTATNGSGIRAVNLWATYGNR